MTALNTVSTDDAYVNSHLTFLAARVPGQVLKVMVDDNYRVKEGDVLVEIDPEPYRVQVAIQKAAVDVAATNLDAAEAQVRAQLAQTAPTVTSSSMPSRRSMTRSPTCTPLSPRSTAERRA